jgi:hypothetical protein
MTSPWYEEDVMIVLLSVLVLWVAACAFAALLCASALRGDRALGLRRRPASDGDVAAARHLRAS